MNRYRVVAALVVAALGSTGCLVKETTHRVYLSPSGSVAWLVLEQGVRSDEDDLAKRRPEEQAWLDACIGETNPVAEGLRRLGAERVSTRLLRAERPYMVLTDARFTRVDRVVAALFEELGLRGEATLQTDARGTTLFIAVDLASVDESGSEPESPASALLEDLDSYRVVLTDGKFVAATGFDILDNGTAATLHEISDETVKAGGVAKLSLTWRPDSR